METGGTYPSHMSIARWLLALVLAFHWAGTAVAGPGPLPLSTATDAAGSITAAAEHNGHYIQPDRTHPAAFAVRLNKPLKAAGGDSQGKALTPVSATSEAQYRGPRSCLTLAIVLLDRMIAAAYDAQAPPFNL